MLTDRAADSNYRNGLDIQMFPMQITIKNNKAFKVYNLHVFGFVTYFMEYTIFVWTRVA